MKYTLTVYLCDINGEVFKNQDKLNVFCVYRVGRSYEGDISETENKTVTKLSIKDSLFKRDFGMSPVIYVDDSYNVLLFGDESGRWQPKPEHEKPSKEITKAIHDIESEDHDASNKIELIEINSKKLNNI